MPCDYCRQLRQRIVTRFRIKRFRHGRAGQVADASAAKIQIRGSRAQGLNATNTIAKKETQVRGF
jgi:hypothetical protein